MSGAILIVALIGFMFGYAAASIQDAPYADEYIGDGEYDDVAEIDLACLRLENDEIEDDDFNAIIGEHTLGYGER